MILSDNRYTVDYFQKFPRNIRKVGVMMSGGADSTLVLYCLAKTLTERKQFNTTIYLYHHVLERYKQLDTVPPTLYILNYIRSTFPDVKIKDPDYVVMNENIQSKFLHGMRSVFKLSIKHKVLLWLGGTLEDELHNMLPPKVRNTPWLKKLVLFILPWRFPWGTVDKKFVANTYKSLGIEHLALHTNTCIMDTPFNNPCMECVWCKKRFEAFGNYGGLEV